MVQHTPLISTIVVGLVLAFALGALMQRARISPLVGYLLAGVLIGPFTPGIVADQRLATDLAEIGVILLMFGVGLHFSLADLLSVRAIAIPGAIIQIICVTFLGMMLSWSLGWSPGTGLVFGLALSVASTVVVLRALQERRLIETERGRIAVGWLIVEDVFMVLTLVLLPPLTGVLKGEMSIDANWSALFVPLAWTFGKITIFVVGMLVVGIRVIPLMLHYVAHTGSRELFRLAVLSIALGVAFGAAQLFGVSFALGAFLAGMVLSESELSQRAAQESLPLRDAFAVLFFVSVGMLFNPAIVLTAPLSVLATVLIIVFSKSIIGYIIVRLFGYADTTAVMIAASRAQIGEFSFILAALGVSLTLLPEQARDLILAGAILSILVNPLFFAALDRWPQKTKAAAAEQQPQPVDEETPMREPLPATKLRGHVVLVGHGRVGSFVSAVLKEKGAPFLIIESDADIAARLREQGMEVLAANAADPEAVAAMNLAAARCLMVAIPDAFEGGQVIEQARAINAGLAIIARAHSQAEIDHLQQHGASIVVMGEHEIAKAMIGDIPGLLD